MESFFFIPASKLYKINDIKKLEVDEIIIDLEDSVKESERDAFIKQLDNKDISKNTFIRIPIYNQHYTMDLRMYEKLKKIGYSNFIIPKLQCKKDFEFLLKNLTLDAKIILLIENPLLLVELKDILEKNANRIYAISLGSHDFMGSMAAEHTLENLDFYRNYLLLLAKAYDILSIDIASMETKNQKKLKKEIEDGFSKGYDAKFYIHPWQIQVKNKIRFYSTDEYNWAQEVLKEYNKQKSTEEFSPIILDGEIIEKPHINRVMKILKYFKHYDPQ